MKRILISLLLAWVAVAPGIASACAAGCEMDTHIDMASHVDNDTRTPAPDVWDCHGSQAGQDVPGPLDVPDIGAMAAACMVAAAVLMPSVLVTPLHFEPAGEHASAVLLPQSSIRSAPPDKPPQP